MLSTVLLFVVVLCTCSFAQFSAPTAVRSQNSQRFGAPDGQTRPQTRSQFGAPGSQNSQRFVAPDGQRPRTRTQQFTAPNTQTVESQRTESDAAVRRPVPVRTMEERRFGRQEERVRPGRQMTSDEESSRVRTERRESLEESEGTRDSPFIRPTSRTERRESEESEGTRDSPFIRPTSITRPVRRDRQEDEAGQGQEQELEQPQEVEERVVRPVREQPRRSPVDDDFCNPVTGIRARSGGIYAGVLGSMGVQRGNCNGGPRRNPAPRRDQDGPVNPITGIRARQGGIYAAVLNGAGVQPTSRQQNDEEGRPRGIGLFGNSRLVQAINARGGLIAAADQNTVMPTASQQSTLPAWAIAGIVLSCLVAVALIVVIVQLVLLVRRS